MTEQKILTKDEVISELVSVLFQTDMSLDSTVGAIDSQKFAEAGFNLGATRTSIMNLMLQLQKRAFPDFKRIFKDTIDSLGKAFEKRAKEFTPTPEKNPTTQ